MRNLVEPGECFKLNLKVSNRVYCHRNLSFQTKLSSQAKVYNKLLNSFFYLNECLQIVFIFKVYMEGNTCWNKIKLSLCSKKCFSYPNIFSTLCCCRPMIFQTMNSVESKNKSLKYQRLAAIGWKAKRSLMQILKSFTRCLQHWSAEPAAEATAEVNAKSESATIMLPANLKSWLKFSALIQSEVNYSKYFETNQISYETNQTLIGWRRR